MSLRNMMFWPKLLTIAYAISTSIQPYLPLYLSNLLGFSYSAIGVLLAVSMMLRMGSLGLWCVLIVDRTPALHGLLIAFLTMIGTTALIVMLWIPPHSSFSWPAALFCMFLEGIFYEPITVLIDSAIIKMLGDYKMLYFDAQHWWGHIAAGCMSIGIGWLLDEDHDFDTLMGTMLIGPVLLFLLSLSTSVQPTESALLDAAQHDLLEHGTLSPLLKTTSEHGTASTHRLTVPHLSLSSSFRYTEYTGRYSCYKPYTVFWEQLSHISEEDASLLQRVASNTANTSTKHVSGSIASSGSEQSVIDASHNGCTPFWLSSRLWTTISPTSTEILQWDDLFETMPSLQLALMPDPSPETPMIVLATWSSMHHGNFHSNREWDHCYEVNQLLWPSYLMLFSMLLLGMAAAMMNALLYLFLHDALQLPMHLVGIGGMLIVAAKVAAKTVVHWSLDRFHPAMFTFAIHVALVVCALAYTWLQPGTTITSIVAVTLQPLQALAFRSFWLVAVRQVDVILLSASQHHRMCLRSKMSALFESVGPAIGAILAGYLADLYSTDNTLILEGFTAVHRSIVAVVTVSSVVTWCWSISIDDEGLMLH